MLLSDKQEFVRNKLQDYLDKSKKNNNRFSGRAFSKKLGISPSTLSEFLSRKRQLSSKRLRDILIKVYANHEELVIFEGLPHKTGKLLKVIPPSRANDFALLDEISNLDYPYYNHVASIQEADGTDIYMVALTQRALEQISNILQTQFLRVMDLVDSQEASEKKYLYHWKIQHPKKIDKS